MAGSGITTVLLDFFGTMVSYSPSRTSQGYPASHALARELGANASYAGFLAAWTAESARLDAGSDADDREYSMLDVAAGTLTRLLGRVPPAAAAAALAAAYLREWNTGVAYPPETAAAVAALAARYRLAVVTNTHQADLVPRHLAAMGLAGHFAAVVTSVEVGWRKPHPAIYAAALRQAGGDPARTAFAGDTYAADYAGPAAAGMTAFLIDPAGRHDVPAGRRLASLADLPARLAALAG